MLINLHSVHNEIEYWKDSHVFRPERQPLPTLNPVNGFSLGYEGFLAVTHRR